MASKWFINAVGLRKGLPEWVLWHVRGEVHHGKLCALPKSQGHAVSPLNLVPPAFVTWQQAVHSCRLKLWLLYALAYSAHMPHSFCCLPSFRRNDGLERFLSMMRIRIVLSFSHLALIDAFNDVANVLTDLVSSNSKSCLTLIRLIPHRH